MGRSAPHSNGSSCSYSAVRASASMSTISSGHLNCAARRLLSGENRQSRGRQFSWRVSGQPHNQFDIENAQTIFSINHDCSFSTRAASAAVPATRSRRPRDSAAHTMGC